MKIAIVIYSLGSGGAERVTSVLSRHWANAGHNVKVITWAPAIGDFYQLGSGIEHESLDLAAESGGAWGAILSNLQRVLALRRCIVSFKADVVIGMMSTASALVALAGVGLPCISIGAEATYPPRSTLPFAWRVACKACYRLLDIVVAQTQQTGAWLKSHTSARNIKVIANPIAWPLENAPPLVCPSSVCIDDRSIVLAVGRLSPEKGYPRLLEAFSQIFSEHPSWDLVILGEGPEREALELRRDQLGLRGRAFLPGKVGNVGDWYKRASIFAMTSHFEGLPNALLEAMAYGLPAISTDCDTGPRDIIQHNVSGLLVAPDEQGALVAGLRQLMENNELRSRLSQNAISVRDRYAVERISQQWQSMFVEAGT